MMPAWPSPTGIQIHRRLHPMAETMLEVQPCREICEHWKQQMLPAEVAAEARRPDDRVRKRWVPLIHDRGSGAEAFQ